jgi:phosphomannomutase
VTSPTSTSSSASAAPSDPRRLAHFIKAYDVRGVVPEQLDEDVASAIGAAFARV